jgi:hypothetical protein
LLKLVKQRQFSRKTLILGICVAIALLYPFKTTVVPRWRIRVVDKEGKPCVGQFVRQSWKHDSLELSAGDNIENSWTDDEGYVDFPERTIRAGLLQRILFPAWAALMTLAHGSTGISADVMVWGADNYPIEAVYVPGQPLPEVIVLTR